MAIINGNRFTKKEKIKAIVNTEILAKMEEYCEWAQIEDLGYFIEEAAHFVMTKDRDWKDHQRAIKRVSKNTA